MTLTPIAVAFILCITTHVSLDYFVVFCWNRTTSSIRQRLKQSLQHCGLLLAQGQLLPTILCLLTWV